MGSLPLINVVTVQVQVCVWRDLSLIPQNNLGRTLRGSSSIGHRQVTTFLSLEVKTKKVKQERKR